MNAKLFLLALLFALSLAQSDDCQTYSYASKATSQITALPTSTFSSLTAEADIESALEALYKISTSISSPFVQNIYVAQSNMDFYMVKNCLTQQGENDYCSDNGPQYFAYVRNTAFFNDAVRHVFGFSSTGSVDILDTTYAPESATYDPTTRFWYTTLGWSTYQTYTAGGSGKTYSVSYGSGFVAAADRTMEEYCGPCLSNSYAVAASQALAVSDFSSAQAGITSASGFSAVATTIKAALDAVDSTYSVNGLLAFTNGDSYMVKYCNEQGAVGSSECSGHDFLFYVTNYAVYTDNTRRALALDANGTVGDVVATLATYDVTSRQWFQVGSGWSDTYAFASSSSVMGRTYAVAINGGGVVGTDRSSSEPCGRVAQTPSDTSAAHAKAVASLSFGSVVLGYLLH